MIKEQYYDPYLHNSRANNFRAGHLLKFPFNYLEFCWIPGFREDKSKDDFYFQEFSWVLAENERPFAEVDFKRHLIKKLNWCQSKGYPNDIRNIIRLANANCFRIKLK